jgi:hypothetical protein
VAGNAPYSSSISAGGDDADTAANPQDKPFYSLSCYTTGVRVVDLPNLQDCAPNSGSMDRNASQALLNFIIRFQDVDE